MVEDHIRPELSERVQTKLARPLDVAFISKGTVGRVGMLRPGQPEVVFSPQVCYWRSLDYNEINPRFLFYLMTSHEFQSELHAVMTHGSMAADYVSLADQRNFDLTFPPIETQNTIASILGALDDKIELNRRMNATLESLARAIFKSWFVDFDPVKINAGQMPEDGHDPKVLDLFPSTFQDSDLGPIPEGWEPCVFDDLIDFVIGGDWGKETFRDDFVEEVRCIRGADIPDLQDGGVGKMPTRFIKSNSLKKRSLLAGSLAFEISGGSPTQSTGRPVLITQTFLDRIPTPVTCSNFCRFIRLKKSVSPFYVYTMLRWLYDRDEFLQYENGTTGIKNLAFKLFASTHQLLSPPEEVMQEFDRVAAGYYEMIARHGAQSQELARLRYTLLPQLLSGELPVPAALTATEEALA
ncbi:Type I restriction-modification system, specificity subunit S [Rhodopirellula islandica]|uniref:Type I restriction-modification system, specificity subunit S n=1 Tax=Rhodopirellula islandica TaxID=595434 RepID=A0A0J1B639_RHOIS|nr:Type I restriction-modification system, specificity subunit S [Rhodopirellula islandica]